MFFPNPEKFLMHKLHLNNYWTGEKISFFFPISLSLLVVLWAPYHTCIRDVNLWFSKCLWKVVLFCDNQLKLLTEKRIRKFMLLRYSFFFWKRTVTVNLKKFSSNTIFRLSIFGKFYIVKFIYLVEDLIRWKRCFEIFLTDHCAGDIGNENITLKY